MNPRELIELHTRRASEAVGQLLPQEYGFVVVLCTLGEGGTVSFGSSITPDTARKVLRELCDKMDAVAEAEGCTKARHIRLVRQEEGEA